MPVTTPEQEYKRLRSYLNPYIAGPNVDAVLTALATGSSSYMINQAAAVNDNLYIVTAIGTYLDQRLAEFGITRPSAVGLSDDVFREIGIQIKNRKQVRDLINNLLDAMFGDKFTKATSDSQAFEPYNLNDGDTLIINFDDHTTTTVVFKASEFQNIHAATAQEVADAISTYLNGIGVQGAAIAKNDGNGPYVELISNTIGPSSSVTVQGGSAQNQLLFAAPVAAGGNMSTQWTLSLRPGGVIRFTWSGGANPNLGLVSPGDYVNVFGGGFASSTNEGSYTIIDSVGGTVNNSYFDVLNPLGTTGIINQGSDDAVLFYNPIKRTLISNSSYAAVYQVQSRMLQIFMPATTQVIRRSRLGSAHLHDPPRGTFTLNANPSPGDIFSITATSSLAAGGDFTIGATPAITAANLVAAINTIPGVISELNDTSVANIQQDDSSLTLTISYTGSQNIVASGPQGDPLSLLPNQQGPYMYDTTQPFVVSNVNTVLNGSINGASPRVINVESSAGFPNTLGYLIFDYGGPTQEGPVPYIGAPSSNTLLISPSYTIQTPHASGTSVFLVAQKAPVSVSPDGLNYPFYITDVASGRVYAQNLIDSISAAGINIVFTILYPDDIGVGKWGTQYSEIAAIYGP